LSSAPDAVVSDEPLVRWAPRDVGLDALDGALFELFDDAREALRNGRPVVLLVLDDDLLGHGGVADAAAATATVGMARALATEGSREDWRINVLSVPRAEFEANWMRWASRLSQPEGASGVLLRLGGLHLGRAPI